jgi:hypothetical protein
MSLINSEIKLGNERKTYETTLICCQSIPVGGRGNDVLQHATYTNEILDMNVGSCPQNCKKTFVFMATSG